MTKRIIKRRGKWMLMESERRRCRQERLRFDGYERQGRKIQTLEHAVSGRNKDSCERCEIAPGNVMKIRNETAATEEKTSPCLQTLTVINFPFDTYLSQWL